MVIQLGFISLIYTYIGNIFDVLATFYLIEYHNRVELNPIADFLIINIGYIGLTICKILAISITAFLVWYKYKEFRIFIPLAALFLTLNLYQIGAIMYV